MAGLFQGLEIGKNALLGHQVSLQTIGHNIANVNTPGYTRQRVRISSALPEASVHGPLGTGLKVEQVYHVRDLFLGEQYRAAQKDLGRWSYREKSLSQIESIFSEPSDNSLNNVLDQFWNDWSSLAVDAENSGNRSNVIADAQQLINAFTNLSNSINSQRRAVDRDLAAMTADVNRMTGEIARINQDLVSQELGGANANDLRDRRDLLLDELSHMIDVNTVEKGNGAAIVYMGSMVLVDGPDSFGIDTMVEQNGAEMTHHVVWANTEVVLKNGSGEMAGLLETRDELIPQYLTELDRLANALVTQINDIHMAGYGLDGTTGVAFFDPNSTGAGDLKLNQEILNNRNMLAASDSADPDDRGNGRNAGLISELRNALSMEDGSSTFNQFYASLVGNLGVETREAMSFADNFELIAYQIDNQKQAVQGVSLDEEMANLVKQQHAFDAASRLISAMDEALDTVINKMGIIG